MEHNKILTDHQDISSNQHNTSSDENSDATELSRLLAELTPPKYPESWECCGNDCGDACVYSVYNREKAAYDQEVKNLKSLFGQE
ncbi:hypothetical protein [Pelistega ratti]|uniref:hypothetical protein n=1 Tax=Pelistega ratti TaxID=2652177 RepID=UPI00195392EC|nr:hypothetical protein [Pelistega ratti]